MKEPQTFLEAVEELNKASAEIFHALFPWVEPFLDWLSKRIEDWQS